MHLVSLAEQKVHVAGAVVHFGLGETIWTESSYKYDEGGLDELVSSAGFRIARRWTDERALFWVLFLEASAAG